MKPVNDDFLTDEELQERQDALFDEIIGKNLLEMEARQAREDIENDPDFMTEEEVQSAWEKIGPRMNATWQETLKKSETEEKKEARREKRAKKPRKVLVLQRSIAALVVCCVALTMFTVFQAKGSKLVSFHFVMEVKSDHTQIGMSDSKIPDGWETAYSPTLIPDGYELSSYQAHEQFYIINFLNNQGDRLIFTQKLVGYNQDTELASTKTVKVGDCNGFVVENDNTINLVWIDAGYIFQLYGVINLNDMIKIAESVKLLTTQ